MLKTLGIDLAAQDKNTAICAIQWVPERAIVSMPQQDVSDDVLISEMTGASWTGIDAPFGWPDDFVKAMTTYAQHGAWPGSPSSAMRHRLTDRLAHAHILDATGRSLWPLSVSSDRIAVCAWRCAKLLTRFAGETGWKLDRVATPTVNGLDGPPDPRWPSSLAADRGVVEVYPAAALAMWELPHKGYKNTARVPADSKKRREAIIDGFAAAGVTWLIIEPSVRQRCVESDHCLDAFVAALMAFAAATRQTRRPTLEQRGTAQREGWIHLPDHDGLDRLASGGI